MEFTFLVIPRMTSEGSKKKEQNTGWRVGTLRSCWNQRLNINRLTFLLYHTVFSVKFELNIYVKCRSSLDKVSLLCIVVTRLDSEAEGSHKWWLHTTPVRVLFNCSYTEIEPFALFVLVHHQLHKCYRETWGLDRQGVSWHTPLQRQ